MELSQLGEFGLISRAKEIFIPSDKEGVVVGIGDDCAAIKLRKGFLLIATTDAIIEGIHFKLDYIQPYQLGIKSININLSDIAAMGGIPLYALLSIAVPQIFSVKFINEFLKGVKDGAKRFKVSIIGGNVSSSKNEFSINMTVLGEVEEKYMTLRKGTEAGDKIFVTGYLGDSAAGLEILKSSPGHPSGGWVAAVSSQWRKKLVNKHLMPIPRLKEGRFLAVKKLATSMIDISDGLASDIRRICEESNVGANIFIKNIPISKSLKSKIRNPKSQINLALYGGEDYELLFTVKPENVRKLKSLWKNMKTHITTIGEITGKGINLINPDGKTIPLKGEGYNHFKS